MDFSRRDILKFLLSGAAIAAGWSITGSSPAQAAPGASNLLPGYRGSLASAGIQGRRHPSVLLGEISGQDFDWLNSSFLTEVFPEDGTVKQTLIPMGQAHGILRIGNGNLLVSAHHGPESLLLDPDHKVIQRFKAPPGYVYGGHTVHIPEKDIIVVAVRNANPMTTADTGRLMVYDAKDFSFLDRYDSHGIHPHEIRLLPGGTEFAISHYGDIAAPDPDGLVFNILEPKLTILDSKTFEKKRDYVQPIDAIYTHMDVSKSGKVYAVTNQYIPYQNKSVDFLKEKYKTLNITNRHVIPPIGEERDRIAVPAGVIMVDPNTGDRHEFLISQDKQLRSQSVAAHKESGKIFATYVHSNTLIVINEADKTVFAKDGYDYGFGAIRGVTEIPGTDNIAVSDQEHGIAIVNAYTLEKVSDFQVDLLLAPHVFPV